MKVVVLAMIFVSLFLEVDGVVCLFVCMCCVDFVWFDFWSVWM